MSDKAFRFDYYPKDAHTDFMMLTAEQIGVLMQVCNLIYLKGGKIPYDGKWIAQSIYGLGTAKCNRILKELIANNSLVLLDNGQSLTQKMCEKQMKLTRERREFHAKIGQKGGKTKAENERNQQLNFENAIASTSTSTNTNNKPPTPLENSGDEFVAPDIIEGVLKNGVGTGVFGSGYKIQNLLSENAWMDARSHAPGWDINQLAEVYNQGINDGKRERPKYPNKAFPIWCKNYTKGNPP